MYQEWTSSQLKSDQSEKGFMTYLERKSDLGGSSGGACGGDSTGTGSGGNSGGRGSACSTGTGCGDSRGRGTDGSPVPGMGPPCKTPDKTPSGWSCGEQINDYSMKYGYLFINMGMFG